MINHEIYDAFKDALYNKNTKELERLMPNHWILKGNNQPPPQITKDIEFPFGFKLSTDQADINRWVDTSRILTGRHAYTQLVMYVPDGERVFLEYKNRKLVHAWIEEDDKRVDIINQIFYIGGIPNRTMPLSDFMISGVIVSPYKEGVNRSYLLDFYPHRNITTYEFIAMYGHIKSGLSTMAEILNFISIGMGFNVAKHYTTSVNKFSVIKKTAEIAAISNVEYKCSKILIMHDDADMVDTLNTRKELYWGTYIDLVTDKTLAIVDTIIWRSEHSKEGVVIYPEVVLKANKDISNLIFGDDAKPDGSILRVKSTYKIVRDGGWKVGEVWAFSIDNNKVVAITKEVSTTRSVSAPAGCVGCGGQLVDKDDMLYCLNPKCAEVVMGLIHKWANEYSDNKIDQDIVRMFIRTYGINNIADIYTTMDSGKVTEEWNLQLFDLVERSRGEGVLKLLKIIAPGLNDETCNKMMTLAGNNWRGLFRITIDRLKGLNISQELAERIDRWLKDNQTLIYNIFLAFDAGAKEKTKLFGKVFVITGILYETDANVIANKIRSVGGRVIEGTGRYVDYVIVGPFADTDILGELRRNYIKPIEINGDKFNEFYNKMLKEEGHE